MNSPCPASLDTLRISVPPAVMLDAASSARPALDLDDFVDCTVGGGLMEKNLGSDLHF